MRIKYIAPVLKVLVDAKKALAISRTRPADDQRIAVYEKMFGLLPADYLFVSLNRKTSEPHFPGLAHIKRIATLPANPFVLGGRTMRWVSKLLHLKIDLLVANSADLQILNLLYQIIFGTKSVADVIENEEQNVRWNQSYAGAKKSTALWISRIGRLTLRHTSQVILAERCFFHELHLSDKCNVLLFENYPHLALHEWKSQKLIPESHAQPFTGYGTLLLAGTIGLHYGALEAIVNAQILIEAGLATEFKIAGFCPNPVARQQIQTALTVAGFEVPDLSQSVAHADLLKAIQEANTLLLPYQLSPATRDRVPVKMKEAFQLGRNVLITSNPTWHVLAKLAGYETKPAPGLKGFDYFTIG